MIFEKKGQVTVFIIIAVVIVAGILVYFIFREQVGGEKIPAELLPVFDYYQSCIEREAQVAIELAGTQGGYVEVTGYALGSEFAPFSSHLNFLGFPVPYWYYVSANGVIKEQVPNRADIETGIAGFVEQSLSNCDFRSFSAQGFDITVGEPSVVVDIKETGVDVNVFAELAVSKADDSARKTTHKIEIDSKIGKFYETAVRIYNKQKEEAFLEGYALDVLRLYAPVDGVEIQCGPRIWSTRETVEEIKRGLEANIGSLKFDGNYYELSDKEREYFVVDEKVDEAVNLIYSRTWPTKIEVFGDGVDSEVMIAEAVGTQEGMGVMGFCYVPYHFVYDVSFPALIQVYNTEEVFQFPVAVIIDNNVPRAAEFPDTPLFEQGEDFDLCAFYTQDIDVRVFDVNLGRADANISYECFNQKCSLGQTNNGRFSGKAPACYNGYLHLRANGYADKKQLFSSNSERFTDVVMDREFEVGMELLVGGSELREGNAIVSFARDDGFTATAVFPGLESIKLSEGSYSVRAYVYGNSSVVIPESTRTECQDVPSEGILAFFGKTEEKCFDITIPETRIDYALIGGGKSSIYILESELEKGNLVVSVDRFGLPSSLEQLQNNFEMFDTRRVYLEFEDEL